MGEDEVEEEQSSGGLSVVEFLRLAPRYLAPRRGLTLMVLLALVPDVIFINFQPVMVEHLLDDAIIPKELQLVLVYTVVLVIMMLVQAAGELARGYYSRRLGIGITNQIRNELFSYLLNQSTTFYSKSKTGELMSRFTTDMEGLDDGLSSYLATAVHEALAIFVGAIVLVSIDWRIGVVCIVLMPIVLLGPRLFERRSEDASAEVQDVLGGINSEVQEHLAANLVVKSFGLEQKAREDFRGHTDKLFAKTTKAALLGGLLSGTVTLSGTFLLVLAISAGSYLAVIEVITPGSMVAFVEVLWWVVAAFQVLADLLPWLQKSASGMGRIQALLAQPVLLPDAADAETAAPLSRAIDVENLSYSHDGVHKALDGVNLSLPSGRSVAIVGPSGCGKSTLLNVLTRFVDPDEGAIRMDGKDLRELSQQSFRAHLGTVFQESVLFDISIRENIRLGRMDATEEEIEQAARSAEIHELVMTMPRGYDTLVGERGGRLSGGQRQRVAIARAMVRNPALLVLDEATSALDPQTEGALNDTLERLSRDRTTISVTHRLASTAHTDLIVVLDKGHVVEQGSHAELMARKGMYQSMWERQTGFTVSSDGKQATVTARRLKHIPLFANIDEALLDQVARLFFTETFAQGAHIFSQGDPGDKFYIIARGSIEVLRGGSDEEDDDVVAVLQDGDFFGEVALLYDSPRNATLLARTPATLLALSRQPFGVLLETVPELRRVFEEAAAARS